MMDVSVADRTGQRAVFEVKADERLLYAGLSAGIGLPYECATGTCGNCKATLISGDAINLWPEAPASRFCRAGELLLCQTAAASRVELSVRAAFRAAIGQPCRTIEGRLASRRFLTPDVAIVSIELEAPVSYLPGQFVLLSGLGTSGGRAYSMLQPTTGQSTCLDFLVRKNPIGGFTPRLLDDAPVGEPVQVFGPLGRAVLHPNDERPLVGIAGGSGIAGLFCILAHAHDGKRDHPSRLFFGLRDSASSYLLEELAEIVGRSNETLDVIVALSNEEPPDEIKSRFPKLAFVRGLVHDVARDGLRISPAPAQSLHFVAGPPAMVDATMRMLVVEKKVSPTEIRYDRFG